MSWYRTYTSLLLSAQAHRSSKVSSSSGCRVQAPSESGLIIGGIAERIERPFRLLLRWSSHRDGRYRGAGGTPELQRLDNEGELVNALLYELIELETLDQVDTIRHQQDLVDG